MLLSILVFFAVSGAVVGAYYALVHRPEHQVERTFEQRLRELSTFDSETPGAASVVNHTVWSPQLAPQETLRPNRCWASSAIRIRWPRVSSR